MNDVNLNIHNLIQLAEKYHTKYEYLNGGCYIFAKAASIVLNGDVYVNREIEHCAVCIDNKLYDITGEIKNTDKFHPFRPKEENIIANEYFLSSLHYSSMLINTIVNDYKYRSPLDFE